MWSNAALLGLLEIDCPIVQAPMAGASGAALAAAVASAGGLGSLPCAALTLSEVRAEVRLIRQATPRPLNLNFFCHVPAEFDAEVERIWQQQLAPYYRELDLPMPQPSNRAARAPFDEAACELVEEIRPEVVSFHFGLPAPELLDRVKAAGALIFGTATTVREGQWLRRKGCDVVVAQGYEAGGHRGLFLEDKIDSQSGTLALVPQMVDALDVPVIAAGGIADARGIVAALALGAAGVQLGTAYLRTPESLASAVHRAALREATEASTAVTNLFSGRPARGLVNRLMSELGPLSEYAPAYPNASAAITPLKTAAEAEGRPDYSAIWSGQAASLGTDLPAGELTQSLAEEALALMHSMAGG